MSIDLNIDNYELNDLLHLFKLPMNFNEEHLKQAKQIVLKVHPDKSGLTSDYFIFYSKAYKTLYNIWEFRKNSYNDKAKNTEYSVEEEDKGREQILNNFLKKNNILNGQDNKKGDNKRDNKGDNKGGQGGSACAYNTPLFNEWFNKEFEKNKMQSESDLKGYGDWFKNDLDEDKELVKDLSDKDLLDKKKRILREKSIIEYQEVQELNSGSSIAQELDMAAPTSFSSSIFSSLQYEDLHKAHTETVIPVTDEDYERIPKFNSLDEIKQHRNSQTMVPLSEQQAKQYLQNRVKVEDEKSVRVAYDLQKQLDIAKQKNNAFWKELQLLT
jgi:hypothetical protein